MSGPRIMRLADGRRLHMNHGPIDLIVEAFGTDAECEAAYAQAARRFETVLEELVAELPSLRAPVDSGSRAFAGSTARRMEAAASSHFPEFVTPMTAVAGAVADEVLAALVSGRTLQRAYVNDGGDVALYLAGGEAMRIAIAGTGHGISDRIRLEARDPVRGIATSGWRGRSHSLGIADAVTVLARNAATADVAATLIANAVDLPGHPAVIRVPASHVDPDSDLGDRLVTESVEALSLEETQAALAAGLAVAEDFAQKGLIAAAALFLGDASRLTGPLDARLRVALAEEKAICHA